MKYPLDHLQLRFGDWLFCGDLLLNVIHTNPLVVTDSSGRQWCPTDTLAAKAAVWHCNWTPDTDFDFTPAPKKEIECTS